MTAGGKAPAGLPVLRSKRVKCAIIRADVDRAVGGQRRRRDNRAACGKLPSFRSVRIERVDLMIVRAGIDTAFSINSR